MFGKKKVEGSQDYTRVCGKCGESRLLPKAWALEKGPRGSQVNAMKRANKFAIGSQREKYSMQSMALSSQQDRVLQNAICPNCGSSDFSQYAPGDEIPK